MKPWIDVKLGEIAEFINGDRGKNYPSESDFVDHGIPFINAGHLTNGIVDFLQMNYISESRFKLLGSGKTRMNDILYCLRGSLGKTAIVRRECRAAIASSLVIIRPSADCNVDYLYHFLTSPVGKRQIRRFDNGSSQPNLSAGSVKDYILPLPPLSEQRRIAAILDKAEALRAKRLDALALADRIAEAQFVELFGYPDKNPKGWDVLPLATQVENIRYGTGSPPEYANSGIAFIRATNIKAGTVKDDGLKFITREAAQRIEKCRVSAGDLILVRSGVNAGDCAIVPERFNGAYAAFDLVIQIRYPSGVFYNFLINSRWGRAVLEPLTRRAAQPHLNSDQVRNLRLIAPPVELRQEFAKRMQRIELYKAQQTTATSLLNALFASLQHRAFRGEL